MKVILQAEKVKHFLREMGILENKFNHKYIDGELSDYVKLILKNNKLECAIDAKLPEMVRIACYIVFVNTLL